MRFILLVALATLGVGASIAVAATTVSTSESCATTTSASHTVGVDGSGVATVGGDTLSVCATATATGSDQTETVTTTIPGPTTTVTTTVGTTTTSGSPVFSGSAKVMTDLQSHEVCSTCGYNVGPITWSDGSVHYFYQKQTPSVWKCLCFIKDDISLVTDSRYGKAYKVAVAMGDVSPWHGNTGGTTNGAGQLTMHRYSASDYGKWAYYGIAVKVPSWNAVNHLGWGADIASLGYQLIQGDQVAFMFKNENGVLKYSLEQNSGQLTKLSNGWYAGSTAYNTAFMPVTYGQWQDFVLAIKWTADNTGGVQVYARGADGSWPKVFERLNEPTYAIGCTNYSCWTAAKLQSSTTTVTDKMGLYFQETGGESETVYESGLTRSADLATAEGSLP